MKLLGIVIAGINQETGEVLIFTKCYDLKSLGILQKDTRRDTFNFICRESLPDLEKSSRHKVFHDEYTCYIQMHSLYRLGAFAFCEGNYPSNRVIYECLQKSLEAFVSEVGRDWQLQKVDKDYNVFEVQQNLKKYQDVKNVSKVHEAQHEVDELKMVLHENIKALLERQGQLDELIDRSRDLNAASKQFLRDTNKLDRKCCCNIF